MSTDEKKPPEGGSKHNATPVLALSIERGGVFFPIYVASEKPAGQRFMLTYTGQMCQLLTTSPSTEDSTPQHFCPEQLSNDATGGKPCRTCRSKVETITVLLAVRQAKD